MGCDRPRDSVYGKRARELLVGRTVVGACSNDNDHLCMLSPFLRLSTLTMNPPRGKALLFGQRRHATADLYQPATTARKLGQKAGHAIGPEVLSTLGVLMGNDRHSSM